MSEHIINDRTEFENVKGMLTNLTNGLCQRVETDGKTLAVLEARSDDKEKRLGNLESSEKWFVMAIIGAFITALWNAIMGKHN